MKMFLENAEEKDMKAEGYIYHHCEIFKIIIVYFTIYKVLRQKKEVKSTENRISEGRKDG